MRKHFQSQSAPPKPGTLAREIATALRARILDGTFAPGQRFPTYLMIEKEFGSTPATVAKAFAVLQQEGFLQSQHQRGMFVTARPPHQHHYALAFASRQDENLTHFYVALRNEALRFATAGRHFSIFYEITEHTDTEDYQCLLGLVRAHRLAGLIFAQAPFLLQGSPFLDEPGIPRVAIASGAPHRGVPAVYPDLHAFLPRALDYLAGRGRKRVALFTIATGGPDSERPEEFVRLGAQRGMTCRPHWIQAVHPYPHAARWAHNVARLLMHTRPRPDALVVLDDNIVEFVTAGIAAGGVHVPRDLEIVAHTNFPWPTPSAVPVRRLGYDVHQLLELCVERVDALRRGERPRQRTLLPALFEEELATRKSAVELVLPR